METLIKSSNGQWQLLELSSNSKPLEILEKYRRHPVTGKWEVTDEDDSGKPHPDPRMSHLQAHRIDVGKPCFTATPAEAKRLDMKYKKDNAATLPNMSLSEAGKQTWNKLNNKILNDPDRHARLTNYDSQFGGLRVRHLSSIVNNSSDYKIEDHQDGLRISAIRHIPNEPVHTWHVNQHGAVTPIDDNGKSLRTPKRR